MKEKDGTDVWVVGVIEREVTIDGRGATARKVAFLIVKRRDAETLTNFIVDRVWGGSILISDSWRGYTAFLQRMTHTVWSTTASSTGRRGGWRRHAADQHEPHRKRVGGGPEGAPSEAVPNVPRGADAGELPAVVPERAWGGREQAASPP